MRHHLQMLTRYAAWANERLYQTLAGLPESELVKKQRIVFGSIIRTLNHVYTMDLVWQAHLEQKPHAFRTRNPVDHPDFSELRHVQAALDQWYVSYAMGLTDELINERVGFRFIGGGDGSMTRGDIVLHVINHTTYHRGHIADMIYQIPAEPPTTDLPVFLRETAERRLTTG
jgi:uncharacterized damage-inducible protein DinB